MVKGIIFDMDGVIINSEPLFERVEKEIFLAYGIPYHPEEIAQFIGRKVEDFWDYFYEKYNIQTPQKSEAIAEHFEKYLSLLKQESSLTLIPGVEKWMKAFKTLGLEMVIASSSRREVVEIIIERYHLSTYIKNFVSGDSVSQGKPHPEIFLRAAEMLNQMPKDCLVIEDSENGIKGAKAAGIQCVGYKASYNDQNHELADIVVNSYDEHQLLKIMSLIKGETEQ